MHFAISNHFASSSAVDHDFFCKPSSDRCRKQHRTELGRFRRDECGGDTGKFCLNFSERYGDCEPDSDHGLHPDGDEQHRHGYVDCNGDGDSAHPAHDQFIYSESDGNKPGRDKRAQLGDVWRNDDHNRAGNHCIDAGQRHDQRES